MPQFDIITFYSQIFWLTLIFFWFYNFTLRIFLPKITAVLKTRKKKSLLGSTGARRFNDSSKFSKTYKSKIAKRFSFVVIQLKPIKTLMVHVIEGLGRIHQAWRPLG
jgi:hypothetical protein